MKAGKELTDPNSCLNRSKLSEPVFVLCARDPHAPTAVRMWAAMRRLTHFDGASEAEQAALDMEAWYAEHNKNRAMTANAEPPRRER